MFWKIKSVNDTVQFNIGEIVLFVIVEISNSNLKIIQSIAFLNNYTTETETHTDRQIDGPTGGDRPTQIGR